MHDCITKDDRRLSCASIDEGKTVAVVVANDLTKAFDSLNHKLVIAKLKAYGFWGRSSKPDEKLPTLSAPTSEN